MNTKIHHKYTSHVQILSVLDIVSLIFYIHTILDSMWVCLCIVNVVIACMWCWIGWLWFSNFIKDKGLNVETHHKYISDLKLFVTKLGNICNYKTKFQLFWSFSQLWCNYWKTPFYWLDRFYIYFHPLIGLYVPLVTIVPN